VRIYALSTENPCVGGSIPPLATIPFNELRDPVIRRITFPLGSVMVPITLGNIMLLRRITDVPDWCILNVCYPAKAEFRINNWSPQIV